MTAPRALRDGDLVEWESREGTVRTGVVVEHRRDTYTAGGAGWMPPFQQTLDYVLVQCADAGYCLPYAMALPVRVVAATEPSR